MRREALLALVVGAAAVGAMVVGAISLGTLPAEAGYYCSPGFEASYGRCIATASTDEVGLYLNEPGGYDQEEVAPPPIVHRRHRRHGLHERY